MADFRNLEAKLVSRAAAKQVVQKHHYMKTFPAGSKLHFGIFDGARLVGIAVFGYSSATEQKVAALVPGLRKAQMIEMQRLWISDEYGHNTESYCLGRIMDALKQNTQIAVVFTHAGGCKNDCGIVYQASGWLYFGKDRCNDFYLTDAGEYRSVVAELRFGRIKKAGRSIDEAAREVFGPGSMVKSWRYRYLYPINKTIRRRLAKHAQPFPKDSEQWRKDQEWV